MVLRARVCGTRKWRELNRNNCPYPLFLVVMGKRPQRSSRRHATPLGTTGPRVLAKCTDDDAEDKRQDARHYTNAAAFSADFHLSGVRQIWRAANEGGSETAIRDAAMPAVSVTLTV